MPLPSWLILDSVEKGDNEIVLTASWKAEREPSQGKRNPDLLREAWNVWLNRDYQKCSKMLLRVRTSAGSDWLPRRGIDGKRLWTWLRLTHYVAVALEGGERLTTVSAIELLSEFDTDESYNLLRGQLLQQLFRDFHPKGSEAREWAVYAARVCVVLGPKIALEFLDDRGKASLRDAWSDSIPRVIETSSRSTIDFVTDISRELRGAIYRIGGAGQGIWSAQRIIAALRGLGPFLDDSERELLDVSCGLLAGARRSASIDLDIDQADLATTLNGMIAECAAQSEELAVSGSHLLQNLLAPITARLRQSLMEQQAKVLGSSRPEISLALLSDHLPLRAEDEVLDLRIQVSNRGNSDARDVSLTVEGSSTVYPDAWRIDHLAPRSEVTAVIQGLADQAGPVEQIVVRVSFADVFNQTFRLTRDFSVEDLRPSRWQDSDSNPFTLAVVTELSDLIAREVDLNALRNSLASGSSVSLTGQKRVGKSSIVRSMLNGVEGQGWVSAYLPLGQAVSSEEGASSLVTALLRRIERGLTDRLKGAVPRIDVEALRERYSMVGGEWISDVAEVLPPGLRVVMAIDDFDELPLHLREGLDADNLFLFIRSLIDEPWLSLLFVGSELLPTIIANQAHKLNQVVPMRVEGFSSQSQTRELLYKLSGDRVDWDDSAVDRIHQLSNGIPYYSRQIAHGVWEELRRRGRAHASRQDVDASAEELAQEAPITHYIHLWADDPNGMSLQERRSILASAVLRAVAQCAGPGIANAAVDEVVTVAQAWVQRATQQELRETVQRLVARGVLRPQPGQKTVSLPIGLVVLWLLNKGGRDIEQYYSGTYLAGQRAAVITDRELVDLSHELEYRGERISETRLKAWLHQFTDGEHRRYAFLLMRRLLSEGYFRPDAFPGLASELRKNVVGSPAGRFQRLDRSGRLSNFYLLQHGALGASATSVLSDYSKQFKVTKTRNVITMEAFAKLCRNDAGETNVALILDNFSGTGDQLSASADELVTILDEQADPLWRDHVVIVVGAALVSSHIRWQSDNVVSYTAYGRLLPPSLKAFSPEAEIFEGGNERNRAKDLMETIGRSLVPNAPLGYGGTALLVSTYNNCPNNTLPIFWSTGSFAGARWLPLFERSR